ncbi:Oidioi.mRNA.OKI2018_I69.PAR.g8889.t1.cds [Oikopleura dioica]|uniref:Oidioi.mRNA.OKI2018_I69.PAR.g8889.t1.cds n=1 Tax=Oikopleura dioica TaxID=34765 RepID=A0ABN7RMB0_OIKDI|nr:Oidioi.mRNA.OKI2018_I69.PAR.g8889.t1.cds [Oikopleura dioica]
MFYYNEEVYFVTMNMTVIEYEIEPPPKKRDLLFEFVGSNAMLFGILIGLSFVTMTAIISLTVWNYRKEKRKIRSRQLITSENTTINTISE